MARVSILDQLQTDMQEFRRHKLDPEDMTPLHRLHLHLVALLRTEPPWTRQDYIALVEHADRAATALAPPRATGRPRNLPLM